MIQRARGRKGFVCLLFVFVFVFLGGGAGRGQDRTGEETFSNHKGKNKWLSVSFDLDNSQTVKVLR